MATLVIRGRRRRAPVEVLWRDGELDAPPAIAVLIQAHVRAGTEAGMPGLEQGPATIAADAPLGLVAASIALALDEVTDVEGLPPAENDPDVVY